MSTPPTDPRPWPPPRGASGGANEHGPPASFPPSLPPLPPPPRGIAGLLQQHRELVAVLAAAVVVLIVGGAALWLLTRGDPNAVVFDESSPAEVPDPADAAPPSGSGTLLVVSVPSGATVALDAEEAGTTPLWLSDVASGPHSITLRLPGHAAIDTSVTLDPDGFFSLAVSLEQPGEGEPLAMAPPESALPDARPPVPSPSPPPQAPPAPPRETRPPPPPPANGTLSVIVRPWGTIMVDGAIRARESDVQYEERLPPGRYRVRAVHPVLGSSEVTITVTPGETAHVAFDLNE